MKTVVALLVAAVLLVGVTLAAVAGLTPWVMGERCSPDDLIPVAGCEARDSHGR